ncbi:MAG: ligand-binding sensor domain-containing protein [Paraglaciecola sp.]|jgi:ligand-binding sensor domain-containing protein
MMALSTGHPEPHFLLISITLGGREDKVLSHNNIWSIHQQDEDSLWVGTRNGLNLFNLTNGTTKSFLVSDDEKAQYSSSSITNIEAGKDNQLWLNTADGILRFDSKTGKTNPLKISSEEDSLRYATRYNRKYLVKL